VSCAARACGALALLVACGAPHPLKTTAVPLPSASSAVVLPAPAQWHVAHYPEEPSWIVLNETLPDGTQRLVMEGTRAERRGTRIKFAEQNLLESIRQSCRSGNGWVHVARGGAVYWSDTFLGDLRQLGMTRRWAYLMQCGPQAIVNAPTPELWTRHGKLALSSLPAGAEVRFTSELLGEAQAFPDRVLRTRDGGKTFERVDAPGRYFPALPAYAEQSLPKLGDADLDVVRSEWARRAVASEAGSLIDGGRLADGTRYRVVSRTKGDIVAFQGPNGVVSTIVLDEGCFPTAWGSKLLARCREGAIGLPVVYPPGAPQLPAVPKSPRFVHGDAVGRWLFVKPWPPDPFNPKNDVPLLRFDGVSWREYPDVAGYPEAVHGDWLLLSGPPRLVRAAAPDGDAHLLADDDARVNTVHEAQLLDRSVVFVLRPPRAATATPELPGELVELELGTWKVLQRRPYRSELSQALPSKLVWADELHGVGQSTVPLVTTDGGKTFAEPPGLAKPEGVFSGSVECSADACALGRVNVWTRLPVPLDPKVILPPAPLADEPQDAAEPAALPRQLELSGPAFTCEVSGALPDPLELQGAEPAAATARSSDRYRSFARPGLGGAVEFGRGAPRAFLSWSGWDEQGSFTVRTPETPALVLLQGRQSKSFHTFDGDEVSPILVARRFVLLYERHDEQRSLTLVSADGGVTELLQELSGMGEALPLGDGGALVRWSANSRQQLLVLNADGVVTKRRWLMWSRYDGSYLALRGAEPGLAIDGEADGPQFYSLEPGTPAVPLLVKVPRSVAACSTPAAPDALTLFGASSFVFSVPKAQIMPAAGDGRHQVGTLGAVVEVSGSKACVRRVYGGFFWSGTLTASPRGVRGVLTDSKTSYPLTCRSMNAKELGQAARDMRIR
jgi:hypothetical protein